MDKPEYLVKDGIRLDGRRLDELRPLSIEAGILKRADGSAYVTLGNNKIIAAVYGPREVHPRHLQKLDTAIVRCRYNMAPFSVRERKRPGPDRRSVEISKVIREALEPALFVEDFPRTSIDIFIEVLESDAGTRCMGITAASVALADAGVPMKDLVSGVSVGKIDGNIALDLNGIEDNYGEADMPVAIMSKKEEITLLQMDGHLTEEEFKEGLKKAISVCKEIYKEQRNALKRKYAPRVGGNKND
ncbi:MAG: exosome complex exonuclease Rrp41 [Candidatus Hydrothermarchaeota archaeon]